MPEVTRCSSCGCPSLDLTGGLCPSCREAIRCWKAVELMPKGSELRHSVDGSWGSQIYIYGFPTMSGQTPKAALVAAGLMMKEEK